MPTFIKRGGAFLMNGGSFVVNNEDCCCVEPLTCPDWPDDFHATITVYDAITDTTCVWEVDVHITVNAPTNRQWKSDDVAGLPAMCGARSVWWNYLVFQCNVNDGTLRILIGKDGVGEFDLCVMTPTSVSPFVGTCTDGVITIDVSDI